MNLNGARITAPRDGSSLSIAEGQQPPLRSTVTFVTPNASDAEVILAVRTADGRDVFRRKIQAQNGRGGATVQFDRPGIYRAELLNADGTRIGGRAVGNRFNVAAEFRAIETAAPLVGGEAIDSSEFKGRRLKDFDVSLQWKEYPGAQQYKVKVMNSTGTTTLLEQTVSGTRFDFPKNKIYSEPIAYQIQAPLPNGYTAVSAPRSFLFNFVSPVLKLPKNGTGVSAAKTFGAKRPGMLFTWQRTNYTRSYQFELSTDPAFGTILKTVNLKQNFVVFKNLGAGTYYWRVRSVTGDLKSPPGSPFKLVVAP